MPSKTENEKTGRRRDDGQGGLYWVWRTSRKGKRTKMWVGTAETGLDPRTGQRARKYVYSVDKRRCADKLSDLREAIRANGGRAPDTTMTLAEWAHRWLDAVQYDVDPSTFRNYRSLCTGGSCRRSADSPCRRSRRRTRTGFAARCWTGRTGAGEG